MLGLGISLHAKRKAGSSGPVNTAMPTIAGTLQIGQVWTVTSGTWSGSPSLTYQWHRDTTPIGGATATTYTLATADIGHTIKCRESDSVSGTYADSTASSTVLSNDASLSVLTVATILLSTTAWVDGDSVQCEATATCAVILATTVNPSATTFCIRSFVGSHSISIAAGANTITVIVTAADGITTATSVLTLNATGVAPVDGFLAPTIDNTTPTAGDLLTCSPMDTGSGATSYAFSWSMGGNTAANLVVRAFMRNQLACYVTPINDWGRGTQVRTPSTTAVTAVPICTVVPDIMTDGAGGGTTPYGPASSNGAPSDTLYINTAAVFTGYPDPMPSLVTGWWRVGGVVQQIGSSSYPTAAVDANTSMIQTATASNGIGPPVSQDSNTIAIFPL